MALCAFHQIVMNHNNHLHCYHDYLCHDSYDCHAHYLHNHDNNDDRDDHDDDHHHHHYRDDQDDDDDDCDGDEDDDKLPVFLKDSGGATAPLALHSCQDDTCWLKRFKACFNLI